MWIPHFTLSPLKPDAVPPALQASRDDTAEREFLIGFYLANPLTKAWDIDLRLDGDRALPEATEGGIPITMAAAAGPTGRVNEILCRTRADNVETAVARCYDAVSRVLGLWAVRHGRGMDIAGLRAADLTHGARWRAVPFRPSMPDLDDADWTGLSDEHRALAWAYREGRNAASPIYRLLCATRILAAWAARSGAFGRTDLPRPPRHVTREMLVLTGAWARYAHLEGADFGDLANTLAATRERALGWLTGDDLPADAGTHDWLCETAVLADLADYAARQVLLDEFMLCKQPAAVAV